MNHIQTFDIVLCKIDEACFHHYDYAYYITTPSLGLVPHNLGVLAWEAYLGT